MKRRIGRKETTMQQELIDVLVVGAGPTGLTLALQLRRLGLRFRIIDQNPTPSTTSKAIGLQYRVSEILMWMGLFERFRARGVVGSALNFYANEAQLLRVKLDRIENAHGRGAFEPQSIMIPQNVTEALLADALREQNVAVERGVRFVSFTQNDEQVCSDIQHADGSSELIASRYLVSCEGAHSVIRKQAGITFVGKPYPLAVFMADVALDWSRPHTDIHVWFHSDGMFSAIPLPGDHRWRLFVEINKDPNAPATDVTLELIQRMLAERTGDQVTRVSNPLWMSEFRISCRMVDRFNVGRVFLAGDAAHIHSPTGGQGITTGVGDVTNLAWKLGMAVRGEAAPALLDTYSAERLPIVRHVLHTTDQNTSVFLPHSRLGQLFRNHVFLPLLRRRMVQQRLTRRLSQLDMHYRNQLLSVHCEAGVFKRTRVRAGDRTPDVAFQSAETQEQRTLFALMDHAHPTVLIGSDSPEGQIERLLAAFDRLGMPAFVLAGARQPPRHRGLIDTTGDFARLYGVRGPFLYLIRPDGYVGLFQQPIDERAVEDYLVRLYSGEFVANAFASARLAPVGERIA
jgi:2-polyprenyl-6-methoxyphenol hydroxylase-like FAD-dependent oxidoreductase